MMSGSTLLQLFLIFNALAHFRPKAKDRIRADAAAQSGHLPVAIRQHLLDEAKEDYQHILDRSAGELEHDLAATTAKLNDTLEKIGGEIVSREMEKYQTDLQQMRADAEASIKQSTSGLGEHQASLKAQLEADMTAEKQHLIEQLDVKLADAVASFLTEALGHNVDLGAQAPYLTKLLEEHKAEIISGVSSEA
jgi:F0F1-type ATP synthase membrane subunit b/b'